MGYLAFAVGGVITGLISAWSLDFTKPRELAQGAGAGLLVGLAMAALLPW